MSSLALAHLTREAAAGGEDAWRRSSGLLDPMLHSIARGYRLLTPTPTTSCRSPGAARCCTSTGSTTRAPSPAGSP